MPYVSATEAPNLSAQDLEAIRKDAGAGQWRRPLIGSDRMRVVLLNLPAGHSPHAPHRHPRADETMLVVAGIGGFRCGDEPERLLGPGAVVFAPRGQVHSIRVPGPQPLTMLSIVAPNEDAPDEAVEAP
jgi:mannose-6-phosphate isomerase-like protein (cupin superfamily)